MNSGHKLLGRWTLRINAQGRLFFNSLARPKVNVDKYLYVFPLWGKQFQVTLSPSPFGVPSSPISRQTLTILGSGPVSCRPADAAHAPGFQRLLNSQHSHLLLSGFQGFPSFPFNSITRLNDCFYNFIQHF